MPPHAHVTIMGILSLGSLLHGGVLAPVGMSVVFQPVTVMGQPPAILQPPPRTPYLPTLPYPYPRVHVSPIIPISPLPAHASPGHPPPAIMLGYLRLEVGPVGAEIYVDGTFVGRGGGSAEPLLVAVAPGGHRVEFRTDGSGTQVHVFVAAGETVPLSQQLAPGSVETPAIKRWMIPGRRPTLP